VNTNTCTFCGKEFSDYAIAVGSYNYHPNCFVCSRCREPLKESNFSIKNGILYCKKCYAEEFRKKCAVCRQVILDDYHIEAMGQFFHVNHFVCFTCKQPFSDNRYIKKDVYFEGETKPRPFCPTCLKFIKQIPCTLCHGPIVSTRGYDGRNWYHVDCLKKVEEGHTGEVVPETEVKKERGGEVERREVEKREAEKRVIEKREAERKEAERREVEKREAERREAERKEAEKKEVEKRQTERKEAERREADNTKEKQKPHSSVSSMLSESYSPIHSTAGLYSTKVSRSSIFEYPQYSDYQKIDENSTKEGTHESSDDDLEVNLRRVSELANDQLPVYPYSVLTTLPYPKDVDPRRREYHLSDEEFNSVFHMTKKEFESLPQWKRNQLRKSKALF
ncbi:hypothetical protein WA588_001763, partial [Blastocystis sp. NMH]